MATVSELEIRISADARDAEAALARVSRQVSGLGDAFKGALVGVGFGAATAALEALGRTIGSVSDAVVGFNADLEQSKLAFSTLLGSADKADKFLRDLADFAAKTPFEFPDLVTASRRMLAFGIEAEKVKPLLTAVGDAVAGMGGGKEMIDAVTRALGQMAAKTKVSAEEMLQLTEAGIPAWDMLAKKLKVEVATAMDKVRKGTVDAKTMIDAFVEGSMQRFGGMMEKQSKTFSGAMSTIKDSLRIALATALKPFFDLLSAGAQQMATFVSSDAFEQWALRVQQVLQNLLNAARQALTNLANLLGPIVTPIVNELQRAFSGLQQWLASQWPAITTLVQTGASALTGVFTALAQVVSSVLRAAFEGFGQVVQATWPIVQQLLATGAQVLRDAWQSIATPALQALGDQLRNVQQWVSSNWPTVQAVVQSVASAVAQAAGDVLGAALSALQQAFSAVRDWVQHNWPTVQQVFSAVSGAIRDAWTTLMQPALAALLNKLSAIRDWVTSNWGGVGELFTQVANAIKAAWDTLLAPVLSALLGKLSEVRDWVAANWPNVQAVFQTVGTGLQTIWTTIVQPALSALLAKAQEIWTWVQQNWPTVQTVFQTVGTGLQTIWTTIVQPLLGALLGKIQEIVHWVQQNWPTIQNVIQAGAQALGTIWNDMIRVVLQTLQDAFAALISWFGQNWPGISQTFSDVATALKTTWDTVINPQVLAPLQSKLADIRDWVVQNWGKVQEVFSAVATQLQKVWDTVIRPLVLEPLLAKLTDIRDWIEQHWPEIQAKFGEVANNIKQFWEGTLSPALNALKQLFEDIWNAVQANWPTMSAAVVQGIKDMWTWAKDNLTPALQVLKATFEDFVNWVRGNWPQWRDLVVSALTDAKDAADPMLRTAIIAARDEFVAFKREAERREVWQQIGSLWNDLATIVGPALEGTLQRLGSGINAVINFLTGGGEGGGVSIGGTLAEALANSMVYLRNFARVIAAVLTLLNAGLDILGTWIRSIVILGGVIGAVANRDLGGAQAQFQAFLGEVSKIPGRLSQLGEELQRIFATWEWPSGPLSSGMVAPPFGQPGRGANPPALPTPTPPTLGGGVPTLPTMPTLPGGGGGGGGGGAVSPAASGMDLIWSIYDLAQNIGGGDELFARVATAVAAFETGFGRSLYGDYAGGRPRSFGPFQFFEGGRLPEYAAAIGVNDLRAAGEFAVANPLHAATWALRGYLGNAIRSGIAQGLRGEQLLHWVQFNPAARGQVAEYSAAALANLVSVYRRLFPNDPNVLGYARGGVIREPVLGFGMRSQRQYLFGERGPEMIAPLRNAAQSQPVEQHTYYITINTQQAPLDERQLLRLFRRVELMRA